MNLHSGRTVDLVCLGDLLRPEAWVLGRVFPGGENPQELEQRYLQAAQSSQPDAWLFWDAALGAPDPAVIEAVLGRPGDLWHAGLRLGLGGLPGAIDFVAPTWMLNRDPAPEIEATSWRVSLRACLVRGAVLEQMDFIRPEFYSLEGAALEWGHRCISQGVIARHIPCLLSDAPPRSTPVSLALEDELRFVLYCYGRKWAWWAVLRAVMSGYAPPGEALVAWRRLRQVSPLPVSHPFRRPSALAGAAIQKTPRRVSVLIPTLERYPYLRTLLAQLRQQTLPPAEIIVVDQTDTTRRQPELAAEFSDLPVRWIYRDQPGQCSARNEGLAIAAGTEILFLDDDVEVAPNLIETLSGSMDNYLAEAVSGVVYEDENAALPQSFSYTRSSDVFPAGITLARKRIFQHSGLFDLAYERGARADGDLGMRVYLSGALMVLEPAAFVLHHHALSGGLRAHKARRVTYASSRTRLTHRHLAGATELYLARRYFSTRQVRELLWLNVLGTFSLRGGWEARLVKAAVSLVLLPDTLLTLRRRYRQAGEMLSKFPVIPELASP